MTVIDRGPEFFVTNDGYVRLTMKCFQALKLRHMLSDLYFASSNSSRKTDTVDQIEGFTEWVSNTHPIVSLGWDWILDTNQNPPLYKRWGLPYSNIMLIDNSKADLDIKENERLITSIIDQLNWEDQVLNYINNSYGYSVNCQ